MSYQYNQTDMVANGKQRGGCLTTWLVLASISQVSSCYTLFQDIAQHSLLLPQWYQYVLVIQVFVSIAGTIGLWMWKKWGVFCYIGDMVGSIAITLILGNFILLPIIAIGSLFGLGILYLVLRDKWQYFS